MLVLVPGMGGWVAWTELAQLLSCHAAQHSGDAVLFVRYGWVVGGMDGVAQLLSFYAAQHQRCLCVAVRRSRSPSSKCQLPVCTYPGLDTGRPHSRSRSREHQAGHVNGARGFGRAG